MTTSESIIIEYGGLNLEIRFEYTEEEKETREEPPYSAEVKITSIMHGRNNLFRYTPDEVIKEIEEKVLDKFENN